MIGAHPHKLVPRQDSIRQEIEKLSREPDVLTVKQPFESLTRLVCLAKTPSDREIASLNG